MPLLDINPKDFSLETSTAVEAGKQLSPDYLAQTPFPNGCFDDFLPIEILENVLDEIEALPAPEQSFSRPQENLKSSYLPELLPPYTRQFLYTLNSRPFVQFVENLTGINGLIPDPYYTGGGIHVTKNGGHLDIHADFNHLAKLDLERRVNVLIYLNKDWKDEYGGQLEIWDKSMSSCAHKYTPKFNRMCCFNTGADTWHGNPTPVNHPDGKARKSIALYYYTATWDDTKKDKTTQFKPRPGTEDKFDFRIARREFVRDVIPPIIYRKLAKTLDQIGF